MEQPKELFSKVIYQWLDENRQVISRSTYYKYEQLIRNHLLPYFGEIECDAISVENLQVFYEWLTLSNKSQQKHLSEGNRRTVLMLLNRSLEYAYLKRYMDARHYVKPDITRNRHIVKVFSTEQQKKLEDYIFSKEDIYSLALLLALYSGIRIGELCALTWNDVDFTNASLYINKTVQRLRTKHSDSNVKTELVISMTKSGASSRVIPVPEFVINYMIKFYNNAAGDSYVLSESASKPLDPRTLQYGYKRILLKNDIPYLNFHCLRHTFATRCITLGWDVKTLSEVLGHSDIKITMEYYFHSSFEHKRAQMDKLVLLSQN